MVDENTKLLTVYDANGKEVTIQVIFTFVIPDLQKRYVVYTFDKDMQGEKVDVLISEVDPETYHIKEISEEEIPTVLEFYKQVKNTLLTE